MINIRLQGAMKFPHFTKVEVDELASASKMVFNPKTKQKEPVRIAVMGTGSINLFGSQIKLIEPGEMLEHPYVAGYGYKCLEVLETRDAKGDWQDISGFIPTMIKMAVELVPPAKVD